MLQLKKINHRGDFQIGLYFGFDEKLKAKARSLGATWSQTHKCWYVLIAMTSHLFKRLINSLILIHISVLK